MSAGSNGSNYNNYGGTPSVQSGPSNRNSQKRNSNLGMPRGGMMTPNVGYMNDTDKTKVSSNQGGYANQTIDVIQRFQGNQNNMHQIRGGSPNINMTPNNINISGSDYGAFGPP